MATRKQDPDDFPLGILDDGYVFECDRGLTPERRRELYLLKRAEKDFAKRMGSAFTHALEVTTMVVRSDPKLVGLDKIRAPLAWKAALKATGFPGLNGFQVPADAGRPEVDTQRLVDALFEHAVLAARAARDVVLRASCK